MKPIGAIVRVVLLSALLVLASTVEAQRILASTLDASTEQSLKASLGDLGASLPNDKQAEFTRALVALTLPAAANGPKKSDGTPDFFAAFKKLHGLTAAEIMSKGSKVMADGNGTLLVTLPDPAEQSGGD